MKNILSNSKKLLQLMALAFAFFMAGLQGIQAQGDELNIINNSDCDIYVYAIAGESICTAVGCVTGTVMIPPGGDHQFAPCGPDDFIWMTTVHSVGCAPGTFNCQIGRTPNTFTACSGAPWVTNCGFSPLFGTWTGPNSVEFN